MLKTRYKKSIFFISLVWIIYNLSLHCCNTQEVMSIKQEFQINFLFNSKLIMLVGIN